MRGRRSIGETIPMKERDQSLCARRVKCERGREAEERAREGERSETRRYERRKLRVEFTIPPPNVEL